MFCIETAIRSKSCVLIKLSVSVHFCSLDNQQPQWRWLQYHHLYTQTRSSTSKHSGPVWDTPVKLFGIFSIVAWGDVCIHSYLSCAIWSIWMCDFFCSFRNHGVAVYRMLFNLGILCWVHCFLNLHKGSQHLYNLIAKSIEWLECFHYHIKWNLPCLINLILVLNYKINHMISLVIWVHECVNMWNIPCTLKFTGTCVPVTITWQGNE